MLDGDTDWLRSACPRFLLRIASWQCSDCRLEILEGKASSAKLTNHIDVLHIDILSEFWPIRATSMVLLYCSRDVVRGFGGCRNLV